MPQTPYQTALDRIRQAADSGAKSLNLSNLGLTTLPPEIGRLTRLTKLELWSNQLTSLPPEIGGLTKLKKLDLLYNQLASLPLEIVKLTRLTDLNLFGNQLTSLPPDIGKLTNLTQFELGYNQLASLPPEIAQLTNLRQLGLRNNKLASLPPEIFQLTNLTELDLENSQLTRLPPEIVQLTSLTTLNLSRNQLTSLPPEIAQLTSLTGLGLESNQLASLPPEIIQLTSLIQIELGGNQLTSLPPEISQLTSLRWLDLSRNQLTSLPPEIVNLQELGVIDLWGNPLEIAIPVKLLGDINDKSHGSDKAQEILAHYKRMYEEGGRELGEARVLVVGEADAGKTKLLRALLHGEHGIAFKDSRDPTDGIEVNSLEAEGVKLGFWDFGGQELMHSTHRFFLSHRCVYVLVADATKDSNYNEEKIEYWLELLKFYGSDSPVILVASKVENFSLNVNERRLQEKYPTLVKMPALRTSAKTGVGIEDLRSVILDQARSLPSVNVMLPRSFFAVKDALEEIKHTEKVKVIEENIYRRLCEENGITEEERQNTLLALLHDMGVVLHYEDDRLSDFGILNPDWATGGVYKVVNSPLIEKSQGRFTLSDLKSILADEEQYPTSMRRRIVDLMKKFELTFELPFERDDFILPSALPRKQPELSGWDVPCMTFEYRYLVLQISILHRFIVAEHDLIQNRQVWYSGLVIARGDNQALVIADPREKHIIIKVKGSEGTRKEFLYSIRLRFERIHGEEANPEEYVYSSQCSNLPLSFGKMKKMLKTGISILPEMCDDKPISINLRELLDGFVTPQERRKDEEREKKELGHRGDTYITNFNVGGNMESSNVAIGKEHQITQTISNAFPADLQAALTKFIEDYQSELGKVEDAEQKEELQEELDTLKKDVAKKQPNKERIKVTVEGLKKAAENIKGITLPVLETAAKVILFLKALP